MSAHQQLIEHRLDGKYLRIWAIDGNMEWREEWWAIKDLNLGPLACEASALTTELIAHIKLRL
jgi:hypothetical protein